MRLQWRNLTLARWFWVTKMCLRTSKTSKRRLFGRSTGRATSWKTNFENCSRQTLIKRYEFLSIYYSMSNTAFRFRHNFLLSAWSSQSHAPSWSSLTSRHRVNNTCNRVKGQRWRLLIYAIHNFLLRNMLHVFRSNHHCSWKFHKFHRKTLVLESLFSLRWWNYIKTFILH